MIIKNQTKPKHPKSWKGQSVERWTLIHWYANNKRVYAEFNDCLPMFFTTRKAARKYAEIKYGYIKERQDLRTAPYYWRFPKAIKVKVEIKPVRR